MKIKHSLIFLAILVFDQLTKVFVSTHMELGQTIDVIPNFFRFTYLHNTGGAWSILEGKMMFFYIITVIALSVMLYFYKHTEDNDYLTKYGLVLMIAGTIGNLVDRAIFQYVRDFIDFIIVGYDFPVFNIADMSLCIGVFLIIVSMFFETYGGFRKWKH